jgi:Mitochondrial ribosomal protein L27
VHNNTPLQSHTNTHTMPLLDTVARGGLRMSKYMSKAATKRAPLHRKHGNKNYYKGTGARPEGKVNSLGRFIVDKDKLLELVAPDLTNFQVSGAHMAISFDMQVLSCTTKQLPNYITSNMCNTRRSRVRVRERCCISGREPTTSSPLSRRIRAEV